MVIISKLWLYQTLARYQLLTEYGAERGTLRSCEVVAAPFSLLACMVLACRDCVWGIDMCFGTRPPHYNRILFRQLLASVLRRIWTKKHLCLEEVGTQSNSVAHSLE